MALVTLGCGRNEADSDHVAGALEAAGFHLVGDPEVADCVVVNTCTFIAPARTESIEVVLDACALGQSSGTEVAARSPKVLVIGCMAERYGKELAEALPEVAGVLGFGDYPQLPGIVADLLDGVAPGETRRPAASPARTAGVDTRADTPSGAAPAGQTSGRRGLPIVEVASSPGPQAPPTAAFPVRTRPRGPWAYLKIAGGCDRACTFCTIPSYRGRFASRSLGEIESEARWLTDRGVRELVCVSENTTSWGKDLAGGRAQQPELVALFEQIEGLERARLMYLQPDELRPELLDAMAGSRTLASYYDLSLQHASGTVLARMARSGDADAFLALIDGIRARDPGAVFRSSFICGFPGETDQDVDTLAQFLAAAQLDWAGFFLYSPEEGTSSAGLPEQVPPEEAARRRDHLLGVQELVADDAARRFVGRRLRILVEELEGGDVVGRSYRESPETDGEVRVAAQDAPRAVQVGDLLDVVVQGADGVDLRAQPVASAQQPAPTRPRAQQT